MRLGRETEGRGGAQEVEIAAQGEGGIVNCLNSHKLVCPECSPSRVDGWIVHEDECGALEKVRAIYRLHYGEEPDFEAVRERGGR